MYTIRISKGSKSQVFESVQADEVHAIRMLYAHKGYRVQIFKSKQERKVSGAFLHTMKGIRIA